MAVFLKVDKIPAKDQEEIIKFLTLTPEKESFTRKQYAPPPSIKFYIVKDGIIQLPYFFAKMYFKRDFNAKKSFESIEVGKFDGELREKQQSVFDETLEHLKTYRTASLILYTGFGKTFLCCKLIHHFKLVTCVLFHLKTLPPQWIKELSRFVDESEVWVVGKRKPKVVKVIICMNERVGKLSKEDMESVGMLMIDEAHRFTSKTRVEALLSFRPKYIVAATATPDAKKDRMYRMITALVGPHSIVRKMKKLFHCFVIDTGLEFELETDQPFTELCNFQSESVERNEIIIDLLVQNEGWYSMVICHFVKMIQNLSKMCDEKGIGYDTLMKSKKDYDGSKKVLIGSLKKMGEGFDQSNYCSNFVEQSQLTIMGGTFKNEASFIQACGRGTRHPEPYIVLLKDDNGISKRHIRLMTRILQDLGGIIHQLKYVKGMNLKLSDLV